jgi:hypothetical protein
MRLAVLADLSQFCMDAVVCLSCPARQRLAHIKRMCAGMTRNAVEVAQRWTRLELDRPQ